MAMKVNDRKRMQRTPEALLLGIFLLLGECRGAMFPSQVHLDWNTRGLRDLRVVVGEGLERSCVEVVEAVKNALTEASMSLHGDLQGKIKLDTVTIQVTEAPQSIIFII